MFQVLEHFLNFPLFRGGVIILRSFPLCNGGNNSSGLALERLLPGILYMVRKCSMTKKPTNSTEKTPNSASVREEDSSTEGRCVDKDAVCEESAGNESSEDDWSMDQPLEKRMPENFVVRSPASGTKDVEMTGEDNESKKNNRESAIREKFQDLFRNKRESIQCRNCGEFSTCVLKGCNHNGPKVKCGTCDKACAGYKVHEMLLEPMHFTPTEPHQREIPQDQAGETGEASLVDNLRREVTTLKEQLQNLLKLPDTIEDLKNSLSQGALKRGPWAPTATIQHT